MMHERSDPTLYLPYGGVGKGEILSPIPYPLPPVAGRRAGPKFIRVRELVLYLTNSSTWEKEWVLHLPQATK